MQFGTATLADVQSSGSGVFFSTNVSSQEIIVPTVQDSIPEDDESFDISIGSGGDHVTLARGRASGTIVDDDGPLFTGPTQIEVGTAVSLRLRVNRSSPAPATIFVTSSDPGILSVPATVTVPANTREVSIPGQSHTPGRATVTASLPAELGGGSVQHSVTATVPLNVGVTPSSVTVPMNRTFALTITIGPRQSEPVLVALSSSSRDAFTMPVTTTIPPSGSATVQVTARQIGTFIITVTLSPLFNAVTAQTTVRVTAPLPAPVVFGITPSTGSIAGGTEVMLSGSSFDASCRVLFGDAAGTGTVLLSSSAIRTVTPAHAAGQVNVAAECDGGRSTLINAYRYFEIAPVVTSVTPSFGNVAGGTVVRVTGTNFLSTCGVTFDGVLALGARQESATSMIAIAPPHAAGGATVGVACRTGFGSLANAYAYSDAAESAASISGLDRLQAAPGEALLVRGTRFRTSDRVLIGDVAATILETAPGEHQVRVPEVRAGRTSVTLVDAQGRTSTTGPIFDVTAPPAPAITDVTVRGSEIEVEGSGFRPALSFLIGGTAATVVELEPTRVLLRVPAGITGAQELRIVQGGTTMAAQVVALTSAIDVRAATPRCAPSDGGATVRLTGSGFTSGASVTIDGVAAATTFVDAQTLSVVVPAGESGGARIVVRAANGDLAALTNGFSYVSRFHPDAGCGGRQRAVRR